MFGYPELKLEPVAGVQEIELEEVPTIMNNIDKIEGVFPAGSLEITENGTYDLTANGYPANITANVPGPEAAFSNTTISSNFTGDASNRKFISELLAYIPPITVGPSVSQIGFNAGYGAVVLSGKSLKLVGGGMVSYMSPVVAFSSSDSGYGPSEVDASELLVRTNTTVLMNQWSAYNTKLLKARLPLVGFTASASGAFRGCTNLKRVDMGGAESTLSQDRLFLDCQSLEVLIFRSEVGVFRATGTDVFLNSAIAAGTCLIYVPDSLVNSYKSDSVWGTYANQIKPLSELPEEE